MDYIDINMNAVTANPLVDLSGVLLSIKKHITKRKNYEIHSI